MLKEIYDVNMKFLQYKSLNEVLKKESGFIVTQADGWYLPWAMNYKREHNHHWFSIVDHCFTESKVQVIDKIPEHNGWEDLDIIDEGFIKSGSKCFKLTEVNFHMDVNKVIHLLTLNYHSIVGTSPIEGLNGLRAFREELADLKNQSAMYIENWWEALKHIIDYRNQFVEYLSFLVQSNDSIIKGYPRIEDLSITFAKTVNKWISFRHGLMRSFINKTNDYEKAIQRLDNIILFEEKCANELYEILQLWGYKVNETKMGSM